MAASFNKFQDFIEQLGLGEHDFDAAADVLKVFLTNEQPVNTDTVRGDIVEISMTNEANHGPAAGGADVQNTWAEAAGQGSYETGQSPRPPLPRHRSSLRRPQLQPSSLGNSIIFSILLLTTSR